MITVFYCTREDNPEHFNHIKETCGLKNVEIIQHVNKGEGLTGPYNEALVNAKYDIVTFIHDDIILEKNWGNKLIKHFKRNPEYGIIGVAGSKTMPKSGRWWENKNDMYGQVSHVHEGKTWLSKYSEHLGNKITEVVCVDGVFFSVHKKRILLNFNPNIKGFHFYDIDFSFNNHMKGVKVGVHFDVKITHKSIGETNEEWEENRILFAKNNEDILPIKIKEDFSQRKMKVLIGCLNFQTLTGSELSTLETAKGLSKFCDVSIISSAVGSKFELICKQHGIKTYKMSEPPGYKMGDGKWGFNEPDGFKSSVVNALYQIGDAKFDIIHANHKPITEQLLKLYPGTNFVNIVRSEIIELEEPIIDKRIKKYIAIRPSIKDYMVEKFGISENDIEVIYNAFDDKRFRVNDQPSGTDKRVTLFVGSMDYLRQNTVLDLVEKCGNANKELWLVGRDSNDWASKLGQDYSHVKYFPPTDKIEEFYYKCDETAGILLGRTTIEGFLCGKPGLIYDVDKTGAILGSKFVEVPEDLTIFNLDNHITGVLSIYKEVYNTI